jgi:hypothetical protein
MAPLNDRVTRTRLPVLDSHFPGSNPDATPWAASYAASVRRGQTGPYAQEKAWFAQPPFNILPQAASRQFGPPPPCAPLVPPTPCAGCAMPQVTPFSGSYGRPAYNVFAELYPSQRPPLATQCEANCRVQTDGLDSSQAAVLSYVSCVDACRMQSQ